VCERIILFENRKIAKKGYETGVGRGRRKKRFIVEATFLTQTTK